MKEADVGEDWQVDPVLREACRSVVDVACLDIRGGNARSVKRFRKFFVKLYGRSSFPTWKFSHGSATKSHIIPVKMYSVSLFTCFANFSSFVSLESFLIVSEFRGNVNYLAVGSLRFQPLC